MADSLAEASDEARQLEKKSLEYVPYTGEVKISKSLDLEPTEYIDLTYQDVLNLYERTQKIRSASGMNLYGTSSSTVQQVQTPAPVPESIEIPKPTPQAPVPEPQPVVDTKEVEDKLRQMTTESIKQAEEVSKTETPTQDLSIELESSKPEPSPPQAVEVEQAPEIPKPTAPVVPLPKQSPEPIPPEVEVPQEKQKDLVPPSLVEQPMPTYDTIEKQIRDALGPKPDQISIKRRMLELTKELFNKNTGQNRKEAIKHEITVLKDILGGGGKPAVPVQEPVQKPIVSPPITPPVSPVMKPPAPVPVVKNQYTDSGLRLQQLISTQNQELESSKNRMTDLHMTQIDEINKQFHAEIDSADSVASRKRIFDKFVTSVTEVVKSLPEEISSQQALLIKKHTDEVNSLAITPNEREAQLSRINNYSDEYSKVTAVIAKDIDGIIDSAALEINEEPSQKKSKPKPTVSKTKKISDSKSGAQKKKKQDE